MPVDYNYVYGLTKAGLDAVRPADALHGSGAACGGGASAFVRTRMTEGLTEAPMTVDPQDVGAVIVTALRKGRETVYVPRFPALCDGRAQVPVFRRLPM